ncbi:hypothetical protein ABIA06_006731 [Bradyrhizobium yuanmingense]|uniref:DUF6894 family protein n=1 Tax=Bradyrhizobium yuanmingense TaxID=108015 RepID=UPI0035988556
MGQQETFRPRLLCIRNQQIIRWFPLMPLYTFTISAGEDFSDTQDLPDDEAAWQQAVRTLKDAESALSSGKLSWSLVVEREECVCLRIDVGAHRKV